MIYGLSDRCETQFCVHKSVLSLFYKKTVPFLYKTKMNISAKGN